MVDHMPDDHNVESTWMSLVGLLHWYEFFISVDQTTLWRRHIAWAKPKGKVWSFATALREDLLVLFLFSTRS